MKKIISYLAFIFMLVCCAPVEAATPTCSGVQQLGNVISGDGTEWAGKCQVQDTGNVAGTAKIITGLLQQGTNVTITGSGTTISPYVINSTGSGGSGINQLTGDGTAGPGTGSQPFTLATVNSSPATYGDNAHVAQYTVNGKGLVTLSANVAITPAAIGAPTTSGTGATGTWGISIGGNAATATALAALPTQCTGGQFSTGVAASGNANCSTPAGSGGIAIGTTSVTGGTTTRVLFDNSGLAGEYSISGTGNVAMTTNGVFTTPNLGTPSAIILTNGTSLPITTGVSGLGTGVATALGVATGSAGSFVVNGGALGTPTSGTLTNATGLPISTGVSGLGTGVATALSNALNAASGLVGYSGALGTPTSGVATNLTGTATALNIGGNAATATNISTNGTANQVWGMNSGASAQGWQTASGGMVYPGAGIPLSTGSAWGTSYSATNPIPQSSGGTATAYTGNSALINTIGLTPQLPHWNAALAKVKAGLGNAIYGCVGDSTTFGYYSLGSSTNGDFNELSYCFQLTQQLKGVGIAASNESAFGGANSGAGTRLILGSGWGSGTPTLAGNLNTNSTTTNAAVFTPRERIDTFVLWYSTGAGNGVLGYTVDSGSQTTINTNTTASVTKVTISASSLGMHTLSVARVSGGGVGFLGMYAYNSKRPQVIVLNWGYSGSTAANWASTTNGVLGPGTACGTIAPDLASINLGINDEISAVAPSTFQASMQTIGTQCQSGGNTDVLYMTQSHIDPVANSITEVTQATYAAATRAAAAASNNSADFSGVPVVDDFLSLVSFDYQKNVLKVQANGGSTVPLHLLASGYAIEARDLAQVLAPGGSQNLLLSGDPTGFQTSNGNDTLLNAQNGGFGANGAAGNTNGGNIIYTAGAANGTGTQGIHEFLTNGGTQVEVTDTASAVNYINLTGSATTANPALSMQGTDTNISLSILPKGTGGIAIGTTAQTAGTALDLGTNTNSMLLPSGTTGQQPTGVAGMIRYNSTVPQVEAYYSGSWNALGAASAGITLTTTGSSGASTLTGTVLNIPVYTGGTLTLGTSAAATNPQRTSEVTTGFYSAATGEIDAAVVTTGQIGKWNASGLSLVAGDYQIGGATALNFNSGDSGTAGSSIAIGPSALSGQTSSAAYKNVAIGYQAMNGTMTTAAIKNTVIGYQAGTAITAGHDNTLLGTTAGSNITTGIQNVIIGGVSNGTGTSQAVVIGATARGGQGDTAIGFDALSQTTADTKNNTAVGASAGHFAGTGGSNTFVGNAAGYAVTTGASNVAVGASAFGSGGAGITGSSNTVIGTGAGGSPTTANQNTALGFNALHVLTTGANNVALGYQSLLVMTTGASNVAIGPSVGSTTLTTGANNILIGTSSATTTPAVGSNNEINIAGLLFWNSNSLAAPAVTSCGTSPSIDAHANNRSGTVTVGTVAATSCTVTFAGTGYSTWNHCRVTSQTTLAAFAYSYTTTVLTVTGTSLVGDLFDYDCDGY